MGYLLSLFIATSAIFASLYHLEQGPERLWDFVAFAMVFGGTVAVAAVVLPWNNTKSLMVYLKKLMIHWEPNKRDFINKSLSILQNFNVGTTNADFNLKTIEDQLLHDGLELIHLDFKPEEIEVILHERLQSHLQNGKNVANSFRSLAKYPPAFGLAGTVFGLVELMRAVSTGMPAQETGIKMAIALVATLYGLLMANLLINPAGEGIEKIVNEEEKSGILAIQSIMLIAQNSNLLQAQEVLNSFVSSDQRVNILNNEVSA